MKTIALALAAVLAAAAPAAGAVLYDDLGTEVDGTQQISGDALFNSFSTGTATVSLAELQLRLSGSGPLSVGLYADASTAPGALIATIGSATESGLADSVVTFDPSSPILLAAGTRYWIGLASSNVSLGWDWTFDDSGPGVAGEFLASAGSVYDNSFGPFMMRVVGVPEPAAPVLLVSGMIALAGLARRRRAD